MNKLLYLLVLSISVSLYGKVDILKEEVRYHEGKAVTQEDFKMSEMEKKLGDFEIDRIDKTVNDLNSVNLLRFADDYIFDSRFMSSFQMFTNARSQNTMVFYNPYVGEDGLLWFTYLDRGVADTASTDFFSFYDQYEYISYDLGQTFERNFMDRHWTLETRFLTLPTGAPFVTDADPDPNAFDRAIWRPTFNNDGRFNGVSELLYLYQGPSSTFSVTTVFDAVGTNNSGDPQIFTGGDVAITNNDGNKGAHLVDLLSPAEENVQYGYYGYIGFSGNDQIGDIVPPEWYYDKFDHPTGGGTNSSAMTTPAIDTDEFGNLYVAAEANNVADFQSDFFSPTVWKSTDNGETWADSTKFPESLINEWALTKTVDGEPATSWSPRLRFVGNGIDNLGNSNPRNPFVVTGEDEYSFFDQVIPTRQDADNNTIGEEHYILEYRYEGGQWSIIEIGQMNSENGPFGSRFWFEQNDQVEEDFGLAVDEWGLIARFNPRGAELEAAKDATGEHVIVKYTDFRQEDEVSQSGHQSSYYPLDETFTYYDYAVDPVTTEADTIPIPADTIRVNDIFIGYRNLSEGDWVVMNQSNDDRSYLATRLPKIVPSIFQVPVFSSVAVPDETLNEISFANPETNTFFDGARNLPRELKDLTYYQFALRRAAFGLYNATEPTVMSVKNQGILDFDITSVTPNPARDYVEISYSTDKSERVLIELFNMQGTKIATLIDNVVGQGLHALPTYNTSHLGTGQYYINMTVGNQSVTKILNIIK